MASEPFVPIVTLDSLHAFRVRHFSDIPAQHRPAQEVEDEDDGLGYYPDGVKRTLTDDQIAMFRHSEIYSLLRERQREKERTGLETEAEVEAEVEEDQLKDLSTGVVVDNELRRSFGESREPDSDDEEEYARFLVAEQRELQAQAVKKGKRKRDTANGLDEYGRPPTARRIAREMDEASADNTILDYGEEENLTGIGQHLETNGANGRTKVSYGDTADTLGLEPVRTGSQPTVEGRKIWWPIIGGS